MTMLYEKRGSRYIERPDLAALAVFDAHSLIIGATRYYTGRMTIHAGMFAQYELARAWPLLQPNTKAVIRRDLEDDFRRDDEARANGEKYLPLGADCDRAAWEAVRRAWQQEDAYPLLTTEQQT